MTVNRINNVTVKFDKTTYVRYRPQRLIDLRACIINKPFAFVEGFSSFSAICLRGQNPKEIKLIKHMTFYICIDYST